MKSPKIFSAFTLVELMAVLAIFGALMVMAGGMSRNTRNTFIAQQQTKTIIQTSRSLRRKSMLISRGANDRSWVYGTGWQIMYNTDSSAWELIQVKLLYKTITTDYQFYKTFPKDPSDDATGLVASPISDSIKISLPEGMKPVVFDNETGDIYNNSEDVIVTIIYESVNGKMHAYYAQKSYNNFTNVIGGANPVKDSTKDSPSIGIRIDYAGTGSYKDRIILKSNGEIHAEN